MYISGNYFLTLAQMQVNAQLIYDDLIADGWSANSICAMLGNMQTESTINPGIYQSLDDESDTNGYGLVQWTPNTKYKNWVDSTYGDGDYGNLYYNLARIKYEIANGLQWISTSTYPMTFEQFKVSTLSVYTLAQVFLYNYERPAVKPNYARSTQAVYWYNLLYTPASGGFTVANKGFNFILFRKRNKKRKLTKY